MASCAVASSSSAPRSPAAGDGYGRGARSRRPRQATAASRVDVPAAANLPLNTIVVLMMENRSFDHYLGWLPGADGHQAGLTYTDFAGQKLRNAPTRPRLPGLRPIRTPTTPGRAGAPARRRPHGRLPAAPAKTTCSRSATTANRTCRFIPARGAASSPPSTASSARCSPRPIPTASTCTPAQSYGMKDNTFPFGTAEFPAGFPDTTIFASLAAAGV